MSGLFYTFNIAKRGMSAQQTSLHVVSHNVSNVNTFGYSKQRAVHSTTQPYPMPGLNSPVGAGQLGSGVEVSQITRARDEFIDSSIRRETSSLFKYAAKDQFINSIEGIINEPGDTGLSKTLNKFWDTWQGISTNPENASARKLLISESKALADSFRQTYKQLEELEKELSQLQRGHIYEVNSLLKQVAELNDQIQKVTISGQTPNDLLDKRDVLLDKLSQNINFKVEKGDHNSIRIITTDKNGAEKYLVTDGRVINGFASIDDVSFKMKDKDGKDVTFDKSSFPKTIDAKTALPMEMTLKIYINGDVNRPTEKKITVNKDNIEKYFNVAVDGDKVRIDSIKNGNLMYNTSTKDMDKAIAEAESFDFTNGAIKGLEDQKVEIADYKNQLNNMARTIAIAVNAIHTDGKETGTEPYINFFNDITNSDSPAKDLKVNEVIEKDPSKINAGGTMVDPLSGDNARAKRIAELRNMRLDIDKIKTKEDFIKQAFGDSYDASKGNLATDAFIQSSKGDTIDTYYKGMVAQLGTSGQEAKRVVTNQKNLLLQLDMQKQAVSGVSMDEEMVDMLQFQRGYQANAKMINVVDELLDLVVNGLIK